MEFQPSDTLLEDKEHRKVSDMSAFAFSNQMKRLSFLEANGHPYLIKACPNGNNLKHLPFLPLYQKHFRAFERNNFERNTVCFSTSCSDEVSVVCRKKWNWFYLCLEVGHPRRGRNAGLRRWCDGPEQKFPLRDERGIRKVCSYAQAFDSQMYFWVDQLKILNILKGMSSPCGCTYKLRVKAIKEQVRGSQLELRA